MRYGVTGQHSSCRQVTGVTSYWNSDHGFVVWMASGNVVFRDIVSVDNQIGLTSLQTYRDVHGKMGTPTLSVDSATFANRWSKTDACRTFEQYQYFLG